MVTIFAHQNGRTTKVENVDPAWLRPDSGVTLWVDLAAPTPDEARILSDVFQFHELAIEDALSEIHHPKLEEYDGYLYLILHGIDFQAAEHHFATHDVDFFLGPTYLVTVHDGASRSVQRLRDLCDRNQQVVREGPSALLHRIVDAMVHGYEPEVQELEEKLEALEERVVEDTGREIMKAILSLKRDVASLRRVTLPQRDLLGRLARREFSLVADQVAYRFRDVYDHLVRLSDEAFSFQDRMVGVLEAHLSSVSNRLNEVMKVLTVIATIFMPLTVLTGAYGMNLELPRFPGSDAAQFWWIVGIMVVLSAGMLWIFRRRHWI